MLKTGLFFLLRDADKVPCQLVINIQEIKKININKI